MASALSVEMERAAQLRTAPLMRESLQLLLVFTPLKVL